MELRSNRRRVRPGRDTARSTEPRHTRVPRTAQPIPDTPEDPARWPGGHRGDATPDPIPNSAVKRPSAHGTASQDAGESVAAGPPRRILTWKEKPPTHPSGRLFRLRHLGHPF